MTVFLTDLKSVSFSAICCAVGVVLAFGHAASQELIKGTSDRVVPDAEPIRLVPSVDSSVKTEENSNKPKTKTEAAVKLKKLDLVDPDSTGILDADDGGFKPGMWAGSSRPLITNLLGLLPIKMTSSSQRQLFRRLLLTRADPPVGEQINKSLLSLRIAALFDAGDYTSANKLIDAVGHSNEQYSKIKTEILFRRHDPKKACGIVQGKGEDYNTIYWKKAEAYCLAMDGQNEKALLISEILSEQSGSVEPAFLVGIEALTGSKTSVLTRIESFNGLLISLLQSGKVALPDTLPLSSEIGDLAALAFSEARPPTRRILDGEIAMLGGAITPYQLVGLYKIKKAKNTDLLRVGDDKKITWNAENRSFVLQAALAEALPAKRARIVERALLLARLHKTFSLTALVMMPVMDEIEPSAELSWFAPWAVRAYAIGGNMIAVRKWRDLISKSSDASVLPLTVLSGSSANEIISEKTLHQWYLSREKADQEELGHQARLFYSLLQALDIPVAGSLWSDVINRESIDKPLPMISGVLSLLSDAASRGRVGETVALAIILLGEAGTERSNQYAVVQVVKALNMVGQGEIARQLALEAAVAAGL